MRRKALALVVLALLVGPVRLGAEGTDTASLLLTAEEVGTGWVVLTTAEAFAAGDQFQTGETALYGGPRGARALLSVMPLPDDPRRIQAAWAQAVDHLEFERLNLELTEGEEAPAERPIAPTGCLRVHRAAGTDLTFGLPTGIVLCQAIRGLLVFALVSGELGFLEGPLASDALVARVASRADVVAPFL